MSWSSLRNWFDDVAPSTDRAALRDTHQEADPEPNLEAGERQGRAEEPAGGPGQDGTARRGRQARRDRAEQTTPGRVQWIALEPRTFRRSVIFVLVAISLWMLALWVFKATAHFLFLILLSWLLAIAMEPMIRWLIRRGLRRGLATAITGTLGIAITLGVVGVFGAELAQQISQLVAAWPDMVASGVKWLDSTFHLSIDPQKITSAFDFSRLSDLGSVVAQGAFGVLGTLGSLTFDLLTVIVFAFYFAAGAPRFIQHIASWLPPNQQEVFATVWETSTEKTGGYVISKLILITLSAVFHGIFFFFIGLPGWLPLALLAGITAQLIPMVGTYLGVIAAALVALFNDPINAVWVVVFATIYQQIESYIFTPRVSKRVMDVSAPVALGAVFVGVAIWGPIGALIGIPLAAAVVALLETYGRRYELVVQVADMTDDPVPPVG